MMEREHLLARLQEAAVEVLGDDAPVLTEETKLGDDDIDSLDLVEILMIVEDSEGFVIDGEAIGDVTNLAGVIDVILERRHAQAG
jgi:acyl carrier protein